MKKLFSQSVLSLLVLLMGCSSNTSREVPSQVQNEVQHAPVIALVDERTESPLPPAIDSLTLAHALALALKGSPELQSFSYAVRAGESRLIQAGVRPNPVISLDVEDVLGNRTYQGKDQAQSTLLLSQVIDLGGKRPSRLGVASAFHSQLKDQYEIKRVEVLSDVTDKFIRTVADEHLLMLAEKAEVFAKIALRNIQRRAKVGGLSELEESKATVLLARSSIAKEHAEHELKTSKRELAALWGSDTVQFRKLDAQLLDPGTIPSLETLETRIEESYEIRNWVSEKRLREAEEKLARSNSIPDFSFGFGPRRYESTDAQSWVFEVSMPLPLFDRNQGGVAEAGNLKAMASIDELRARLRLKTALFGLYQELNHAHTEVAAMKDHIVPHAERSLKVAQHGYDQGRFSYLDLMDTQRTLLEVYREQIEAAYSFHHYHNAIERLLGDSIDSLGQ